MCNHGLDEVTDVTEDDPVALAASISRLCLHGLDLDALHYRMLHDAAGRLKDAP